MNSEQFYAYIDSIGLKKQATKKKIILNGANPKQFRYHNQIFCDSAPGFFVTDVVHSLVQ